MAAHTVSYVTAVAFDPTKRTLSITYPALPMSSTTWSAFISLVESEMTADACRDFRQR